MFKKQYFCIPAEMFDDPRITSLTQVKIFKTILSLSARTGYCYAGTAYLAKAVGCSESIIRKTLHILTKGAYIEVYLRRGSERIIYCKGIKLNTTQKIAFKAKMKEGFKPTPNTINPTVLKVLERTKTKGIQTKKKGITTTPSGGRQILDKGNSITKVISFHKGNKFPKKKEFTYRLNEQRSCSAKKYITKDLLEFANKQKEVGRTISEIYARLNINLDDRKFWRELFTQEELIDFLSDLHYSKVTIPFGFHLRKLANELPTMSAKEIISYHMQN